MKLLRKKTYQDLLNANSVLSSKLAKSDLDVILLKKEIGRLNSERDYVNMTRDKKGVLHSINPSEKIRKRKVTVLALALSTKEFAEKHLGERTKTDIGIGKICGYDPTDSSILVGFDDSLKGHGGSSSNGVKLKEYSSYYWQNKDLIKSVK